MSRTITIELTETEAVTVSVALGRYADARCEESREAGITAELAQERRNDCKRANAIIERMDALVAEASA